MWEKRKQLIIATAVVGLLAAGAPALEALAQSAAPFGKGNPLDNLQAQVDSLNSQLRDSLNRPTPTNLTGDYAVLGNMDCMVDSPGFGPNLSVNAVQGQSNAAAQHQTFIGTKHYFGDGTGTETLSGMVVASVPFNGAFPIGTFTVASCNFRYAVNADGTFTETRLAGCIATGGDGSTTTSESDVKLHGRISNGGKTLLLGGITPAVERFVNTNSGAHERVCTRNNIATKIK